MVSNIKKLAILAALSGLIILVSQSNEEYKKTKQEALVEKQKSFSAELFLINNYDEVAKNWGDSPRLNMVKNLRLGKSYTGVVIFSNCKPKEGECSLDAYYSIYTPDNEKIRFPLSALWRGPVGTEKFHIADNALSTMIGPADTPGEYTVEVAIIDNHSGKSRVLTRSYYVSK